MGIAGAKLVRELADLYGIPVVLHTDHCAKKLLPWFDGLLEANEEYFAQHGEPLFSSHMLDLSEEPIEENLEICKEYQALEPIAPGQYSIAAAFGNVHGVYKPGNVK